MATAGSVDEYLAGIPAAERAALEELRATVRAAVPDAAETISYQMPTVKYRGRALVGFAAFAKHCSLFPYSKGVLVVLQDDLRAFDTSGKGGTIRFTVDAPLPADLVRRIVATRIAEIDERLAAAGRRPD
jgi:uncharacterized protein YdhG (YjbR/CyaY superfamily)